MAFCMKKYLLLLCLLGLFYTSCEQLHLVLPDADAPNSLPGDVVGGEDHKCDEQLVFDVTSEGCYTIDVLPEGRTVDVIIKSNIEYDFKISSDATDWLSASQGRADVNENVISFTLSENVSEKLRSAMVLFTNDEGDIIFEIMFKQYGQPSEDDIFEVSGEGSYTVDVDAEGGVKYLTITTNLLFNIVIPEEAREWITLEDTRVAATTKELVFVIAANVDNDERKAKVRLTNDVGATLFSLTFRQKANETIPPTFKVAQVGSYEISPYGGVAYVAVTANVDYDVIIHDEAQSWLTVSNTRAEVSLDVVSFVASKNDSGFERIANVEFTDGNESYWVTIKQSEVFDILFEEKELACMANTSVTIDYTILGGDSGNSVEAIGNGGWSADVISHNSKSGTIKVTAPKDAKNGKIVVLATSGSNEISRKTLNFDEGILSGILETYEVDCDESTLAVTVNTNLEYDVIIPEDVQSWICVADTRAKLRNETLSFTISENPIKEPRSATIELVGESGDLLRTFSIYQKAQTAIVFENKEFGDRCVELYDTNGDGKLSYEEAAAVTEFRPGSFVSVPLGNELIYFTGLKTIRSVAFECCWGFFTIPENVELIEERAFFHCSIFRALYLNPKVPPTIAHNSFGSGEYVIYVPSESYSEYISDANWEQFRYVIRKQEKQRPLYSYNIGDIVTHNGVTGVVICATDDFVQMLSVEETSTAWSNINEIEFTYCEDHGYCNTFKVQEVDSWETKYPAFKWCVDRGGYLPSLYEMFELSKNIDNINESLIMQGYKPFDLDVPYWTSSVELQNQYLNPYLGYMYDLCFSYYTYPGCAQSSLPVRAMIIL